MNRAGLGLAVGAGYLLGRTRKLKLAVAVGTFVAGRRMNLGPGGLAELVSRQLRDNPQFKEIGDQLREDLRGVGKAASSALVERRLDALAGRLHERTAETRDRLTGALPAPDDLGGDDEEPAARGTREDREPDAAEGEEGEEAEGTEDEDEGGPAASEPSGGRARARKTTASAKRTGRATAPAKKAGARRTTAGKAAKTEKTAKTAKAGESATGSAAKTAARGRRPKGGGER